jgi:hypothetical protein
MLSEVARKQQKGQIGTLLPFEILARNVSPWNSVEIEAQLRAACAALVPRLCLRRINSI